MHLTYVQGSVYADNVEIISLLGIRTQAFEQIHERLHERIFTFYQQAVFADFANPPFHEAWDLKISEGKPGEIHVHWKCRGFESYLDDQRGVGLMCRHHDRQNTEYLPPEYLAALLKHVADGGEA